MKGDLSDSCWSTSMQCKLQTSAAPPALTSPCRCQLLPAALPAWTHSTGFHRKLQMKPLLAAYDYSEFAQANAQVGSWPQEAPEAFNRSTKLEFLYFLPFVARPAVILKSRSSRFPCSTAKQSLTIKCPNSCHQSRVSLRPSFVIVMIQPQP